jgi:hypothetical protein
MHPTTVSVPLPDLLWRLWHWLKSHATDEWLIACLAMLLSVCAYAWYDHIGMTLGYGDAVSRMVIARRVVAGRATGLAQLGTTWLPLHTILMLPLIWNDTLFRDGIAGSFPSMVAYVLTAVYLYRMALVLFAARGAAWVAALIFLFNPSVLYMQSTAMSEIPLLSAATIAIYYILLWARSYHAVDLVKCAAVVAVGAGIRYDGWALAAVLTLVVIYVAWRRQGYAGAESHTIVYGLLAFSSCAAWVIYNAVIFHDPFLFFFFGSKTHAVYHLQAYHRPTLAFEMFGYAAGATAGWMMTGLAVIGFFFFLLRYRLSMSVLPVYALLTPIAYHWLVFYEGIDSILLPQLGDAVYWNARFGLMLLPAIVIFAAYLAHLRRYLLVGVLGAILAFFVINATIEIPMALREPASGSTAQHAAAQWLLTHYHGGNVLITYIPDAPMVYSLLRGLPDQTLIMPDQALITDADSSEFTAALAHPENWVKWIVLDDDKNPQDAIWFTLHNRHDWQRYFALRQSFGTTHIYEFIGKDGRRGAPQSGAPQTQNSQQIHATTNGRLGASASGGYGEDRHSPAEYHRLLEWRDSANNARENP